MEYGKLPPQAIEIEEAIIGAVMIEKSCINEATAIITNENYFYKPAHVEIWKAIRQLNDKDEPIDMLTVIEQVKANGKLEAAGGYHFIAQLSNKVGSAAHVEYHATIIKEAYLKRKMIEYCSEIVKLSYSDTDDALEVYDKLVGNVDEVSKDINRTSYRSFYDHFIDKEKAMIEAAQNKSYTTGIKTFVDEIDRVTLGWQRQDLIILAARPSMGKTALAVDIARRQAGNGIPVGIFSLEMSTSQLIDRIIAAETQIPLEQVRKGGLTGHQWEVFNHAKNHLANLNLHISDKGGSNINELVSTAKNWKLKHNIEVLYIDYLQLMNNPALGKGASRENEIGSISRKLKALAKDLNIPVIALSQLSRKCEERTDKRPMMSDLRDSGAIEQDADIVMFPFRPEYYDDGAEKGLCEVNFAKNRNGKIGCINLRFDGEYQRFYPHSFTETDHSPF